MTTARPRPSTFTRSSPRRVPALLAAAVSCLLLAWTAGCGGGSGDDPDGVVTTTTRVEGSPLDEVDLERMAIALFRNYDLGGADILVSFTSVDGAEVRMEGQIDWRDHVGTLRTVESTTDGRIEEVVWFREDAVLEALSDAQRDTLPEAPPPQVAWLSRPPDLGDGLDQVIQLIVGLAATQPDNPALLAQQGLSYDGTEVVEGTPTTRYGSATGATYWLTDDSTLVRFRGTLSGLEVPVTVDLIDHGPRKVDLPGPDETIDVADLDG